MVVPTITFISKEHAPAILTFFSILAGFLGIVMSIIGGGQTLAFGGTAVILGIYPILNSPSTKYKLLGGIGIILGIITIVLWISVFLDLVANMRNPINDYGMPNYR